MAQVMIDYQNEIEAQTTYLQGTNEMQNLICNFNEGLAADGQPNQDLFQDDKDTTIKKLIEKN